MAGRATSAVDIAKVLQHILFWMSRVMRWNAVIMLAPTDSATNIVQVLGTFDAADDIVIQEGTYTFSRQSVDACKEVHFTWTAQAALSECRRFTVLDAVSEGIRLASQCRFRDRGPHRGWNPLENGQPRSGVLGHDARGLL
jgi:hypothetical protein